ncbi:MAG: hypothetical protein IJJ69_13305 [Oscillospiraceae bacterium]|nr:hypothetical protein [Oscillospiraceae bacterium]
MGEVTETETETVKPIGEYTATWEIGKRSAYAGDTGVKVPVSVEGDAPSLSLSTFKFDVDIQDGPTYTGYEWGSAYELMGKEFNTADYIGAGSAGEQGSVQADNGSSVIILTFDIPADLEPGRYAITFNGDVQAVRIDDAEVDVNEVNGYIDVLPPEVTIQTIEYRYNVVGKSKFYFAHDTRAFDMNDLLSMATLRRKEVYSDGTESDWTIANEFDGVTFTLEDEALTSPKAVYDREILKVDENGMPTVEFSESDHNAYFKQTLKFKIVDANAGDDVKIIFVDENGIETEAVTGNVYIGVKGDASLNGTVNANDAAIVLKYAAAFGAGLDPVLFSADDAELEAFAYFLAEVTGESEDHGVHDSLGNVQTVADLNASDAAFILKYAAQAGAGLDPDWYEILPEPLPKYTKAIGRANGGVNDKN